MQDIHGIYSDGSNTGGGGHGGPIFSDRRIRSAANSHHQQALKCPRCNSSNTKFCYYNNYNLSQPRHFCKNCRRYWTNGGVLRNVPVGGGNRKSKRSSKRKALSPPPLRNAATKSNSRSSSESTSAKAQSAGGFAEDSVTGSGSNFTDQPPVMVTTTLGTIQAMNSNFESLNDSGGIANSCAGGSIFTEIGGFVSFMSGNHNENLFGFGSGGHVDPTPFRIHQQNPVNHQQHDNRHLLRNPTGPGILDQTVHVDLHRSSQNSGGGVFARSDWESVSGSVGGGRGHISNLFDLATGSSGAHGGQWSQSDDQWHESEHDHHLYLPP